MYINLPKIHHWQLNLILLFILYLLIKWINELISLNHKILHNKTKKFTVWRINMLQLKNAIMFDVFVILKDKQNQNVLFFVMKILIIQWGHKKNLCWSEGSNLYWRSEMHLNKLKARNLRYQTLKIDQWLNYYPINNHNFKPKKFLNYSNWNFIH